MLASLNILQFNMFINSKKKCYLILQVFFWYLDRVILESISTPLVGDLLGYQLFKDEEQQFIVVPTEGQVRSKRLQTNIDNTNFTKSSN